MSIDGGGNLIDQFEQIRLDATVAAPSSLSLLNDGNQWYILNAPSVGLSTVESYQPSDNQPSPYGWMLRMRARSL